MLKKLQVLFREGYTRGRINVVELHIPLEFLGDAPLYPKLKFYKVKCFLQLRCSFVKKTREPRSKARSTVKTLLSNNYYFR